MATTQSIEDARMAMIEAVRAHDSESLVFGDDNEAQPTWRGIAILLTIGSEGMTPCQKAPDVAGYINDVLLEYGRIVAPDDVDEQARVQRVIWQALADRAAEVLPGLKRMTGA